MYNQAPSEFWPKPTAHRVFWEMFNDPNVYAYSAADDGPEIYILWRRELHIGPVADGPEVQLMRFYR